MHGLSIMMYGLKPSGIMEMSSVLLQTVRRTACYDSSSKQACFAKHLNLKIVETA